jgi:4-diphosphocytidyl-2-C-methyl-D-erythritol kinase
MGILKSCAKINVGLRIKNKRDDGFHNIETIFYPIKLYDEIKLNSELVSGSIENKISLKCNKYYIPTGKNNICYKVIENFFDIFEIREKYYFKVFIKKNIPVGGGLGGGSSNAACVIIYLLKKFNINLVENRNKIMELALNAGSDVPFFLFMRPSYAAGRGEKINFLPDFNIDYDILIINPNIHISTKWAFENLKPVVNSDSEELNKIKNFILDPVLFRNDFEPVVFEKYPELQNIKNELLAKGAVLASLSGSGATMYGLFERNKKYLLSKAHQYYKQKNYFTFIS